MAGFLWNATSNSREPRTRACGQPSNASLQVPEPQSISQPPIAQPPITQTPLTSPLSLLAGRVSSMASTGPLPDSGASNVPPTYDELQTRCTAISQLLKDTKKPGAEDLRIKIGLLSTALGSNKGATNPLPQSPQILGKIRTIESTVRYWTDKGFGARLPRAWNRLRHDATHDNLERCSERVQEILASFQLAGPDRHEPTFGSPEATPPGPKQHSPPPSIIPEPSRNAGPNPPPATFSGIHSEVPETSDAIPAHKPNDTPTPAVSQPMKTSFSSGRSQTGNSKAVDWKAFRGVLRAVLTKVSGLSEPLPFGNIIKTIADAGLGIMDVLEAVDSNHDEARNIGAHISSLAQAIVQFLPQNSGNGIESDEELKRTLQSFSETLVEVFEGLQSLYLQGKVQNVALREQNRADLQGYDQKIQRAFQNLQVRLQLYALRSLSEQQRKGLFDRLGAADNGAKDKAPTPEELLCLPGTRELILNSIHEWIETPSSSHMMWLNGVAGCGKSTIAATVFHHLQQLSRTAAIFYCTASDQPRCSTIVSTLAYWLANASHGSLEKPIRQAITKHPEVAMLQLSEQVELLLSAPLATVAAGPPPTVIIIDGLDEWYHFANASALVSSLANMAAKRNVKVLVTSRDEKHIRDAFPSDNDCDDSDHPNDDPKHPKDSPVWKFSLDEEDLDAVEADIRVYLEHNLRQIRRKTKLRKSWPSAAQLDALVRKSEHLFQFAATTVRYIGLGYPPDALDAVLNNAQTSSLKELDVLYMLILCTVFKPFLDDKVTADVLQHVLRCLVCSAVPIGLDVIVYLRGGDLSTEDDYSRIRQSALDHLGSFLIVPEDPHLPIRFLHTSFVDFLKNPGLPTRTAFAEYLKNPQALQTLLGDIPTDSRRRTGDPFFVDVADGHVYLTQQCLKLLNCDLKQNICGLKDFTCGVDGTDGMDVAEAVGAGLRYASLHWTTHLDAEPSSSTSVDVLSPICEFASVHILHWIEVLALLRSVASVGHPASRKAADWCSRMSSTGLSATISLFRDTTRFIGLFASIISSHPLTLYEYVLSFLPTEPESMLRKTYGPRVNTRLKIIRGPMRKQWRANQWAANHGDCVSCIALSPDGSTIASGGADCRIKLWDAKSGMPIGELLEGHTKAVESLAFGRDGRFLVSSSGDKTTRIWDVERRQARGRPLIGHTSGVDSVATSPDGTTVASGSSDGTVRFWGLQDGREMGDPLKVESGVYSVAFTPDGSTLVCGCSDGSVRRWNVKTREAIGEAMTGHTKWLWSVCVSPNGKVIASGSGDNSIRLWCAESGEQIGAPLEGHTSSVQSVAFSPDGETIVSGAADNTIRLWDARTGKQRGKALMGHPRFVYAVAFALDGETVISGSFDGTVRAWDVDRVEDEGEEVEGHSKYVHSVAFTSDARFVATGSLDGSIFVWLVETGTLLGKVKGRYTEGRLRFSADGRALREDESIFQKQWDVSGAVEGTGAEMSQAKLDKTLAFPDLGVEWLRIDDKGWISRGGRKWFWVPKAFVWDQSCCLFGTKLVLETPPVHIIDVAGLL